MPVQKTLAKSLAWLAALVGALLMVSVAIMGIALLSGDVVGGNITGLVIGVAVVAIVALPLLAAPFSVAWMRRLALLAIACVTAFVGYLAFFPQPGVAPSASVRLVIVALALLIVVRVLLARRNDARRRQALQGDEA